MESVNRFLTIGEHFFYIFANELEPFVCNTYYTQNYPVKQEEVTKPEDKVFLNDRILFRDQYEIRYNDVLYKPGKRDSILPIHHVFTTEPGRLCVAVEDREKLHRTISYNIVNHVTGHSAASGTIRLSANKWREDVALPQGVYDVYLEDRYVKTLLILPKTTPTDEVTFLFHNDRLTLTVPEAWKAKGWHAILYCPQCQSLLPILSKRDITHFREVNYPPFKEMIDFEKYPESVVNRYIKQLPVEGSVKQGLHKLLTMVRVSTIEEEISIMEGIFQEDEGFAMFISEQILSYPMIPLLVDRELQDFLRPFPDKHLFIALRGEKKEVREKVLRNISRRRRESIIDGMSIADVAEKDRREMKDAFILALRNYLERRIGRGLFVPKESVDGYHVEGEMLPIDEEENTFYIPSHPYTLFAAFFDERNRFRTYAPLNRVAPPFACKNYCIEDTAYDSIFRFVTLNERHIEFRLLRGVKTLSVVITYWDEKKEYTYNFNFLPRNTLVPLPLYFPIATIHVACITGENVPYEQLFRLAF